MEVRLWSSHCPCYRNCGWGSAMGRARSFLFLVIASLTFAPTSASGNSDADAEYREFPIKIYQGYLIVVEGSVGDVQGLSFLLDTGASNSAIDRRVAEKFALPRKRTRVINFDKAVPLESCEVPQLTYGPEHGSHVRLVVEDLSYLRASGVQVDGVIGLDLLRRKNFLVDYARKFVRFGGTENQGMSAVPMRADAILLRVGVELGGKSIWMIVDTGTRETVMYRDRIENMVTDYRVEGRTMGRSLGGAVESQLAVVPRLRLGGKDLEREVMLVRAPEGPVLPDVAGYLGPVSLKAKQVAFDFEKNQLLWTR